MATTKRKRKRRSSTKKKSNSNYKYPLYQVTNIDYDKASIKVNGRETITVRFTNLKGKFHSLINILQERGYQYLIADKEKQVINLKPNDYVTTYIYDKVNIPDKIFIYDETKQVIIGYIPLDKEVDVNVLVDIFKACQYIYKQSRKDNSNNQQPSSEEQ